MAMVLLLFTKGPTAEVRALLTLCSRYAAAEALFGWFQICRSFSLRG
jgi:hypothetical protein